MSKRPAMTSGASSVRPGRRRPTRLVLPACAWCTCARVTCSRPVADNWPATPALPAGLGGRLGDGRQWMPWITVDDLVRLYGHVALTPGLSGPVNAAQPGPAPGSMPRRWLAALRRPSLLPVPSVGPCGVARRRGRTGTGAGRSANGRVPGGGMGRRVPTAGAGSGLAARPGARLTDRLLPRVGGFAQATSSWAIWRRSVSR